MAAHTDASREPLSLPSVGFRPSARAVLVVVVLILVYSIGWRVTNIDFLTLVTGVPKAERIVSGLMQPDVAAETTQSITRDTPLRIGEGSVVGDAAPPDGAQVRLPPNPIVPGQELTISGSGFRPSTNGRLPGGLAGSPPADPAINNRRKRRVRHQLCASEVLRGDYQGSSRSDLGEASGTSRIRFCCV